MGTSLKILVTNTQFLDTLETSWLQFRTLEPIMIKNFVIDMTSTSNQTKWSTVQGVIVRGRFEL